jgi:hypothetical protein
MNDNDLQAHHLWGKRDYQVFDIRDQEGKWIAQLRMDTHFDRPTLLVMKGDTDPYALKQVGQMRQWRAWLLRHKCQCHT